MRTVALSLLLAASASAQQPPVPPKVDGRTHQQVLDDFVKSQLVAEKPPAKGSVEEAILNALQYHPDIRLAEAKRQMAEAELEQAKFLAAQRVAAAFAKVEQAKASLVPAQEYLERIQAAGAGSKVEVLSANAQYQRAKAEAVAAELELKAAKGATPRNPGTPADPNQEATVRRALTFLSQMQEANSGAGTLKVIPAGSTADRLKAMLDRPIKFDLKNADLDDALAAVLKAAGEPSLTVKLPPVGKKFLKSPPTVTHAAEMPFTAAVQFLLDEINSPMNGEVFEAQKGRLEVYVREYGLLIARVQDAPPGAPTLAEFARQVRAEKGEKK